MPLAMSGPQAPMKPVQFTPEQISALAAYVASVSPGARDPRRSALGTKTYGENGLAVGGELFRINCAMCHNVAGAGGALTQGKYAPPAGPATHRSHIYEAMLTDRRTCRSSTTTTSRRRTRRTIIAYLKYIENMPSVGGASLGSIGPVSEGLFVWIGALGLIVGITIWLTAKSN